MEFLSNPIFLLAVTFVSYIGAQALQRRLGIKLLNPILVSIIAIILFLNCAHIDYATYSNGGKYVDFWLKPAVVALGLPLYRQLSTV